MELTAVAVAIPVALGTFVALLAWRYRHAPGLRDQGWFAAVAASAGAYAALSLVTSSPSAADETVLLASRGQTFLLALHSGAWLRYAAVFLGSARPWERPAGLLLGLAGAGALVPGVALTGRLTVRPSGLGDLTYRDAELTPYALAVILLALLLFGRMAWRFAAAAWRGVPYARAHLGALGLYAVMGVNDLLRYEGLHQGPFLLDVGFLLPVAVVTYALAGRVVDESRGLADLRSRLEQEVAARTAELDSSRAALAQAEKLASLGRFSAGVSHEVSNPAAVVAANLRYLEQSLRDSAQPPPDALECLSESREAVERISILTRQLLDASRYASAPDAAGDRVAVAPAVAQAVAAADALLSGHAVSVAVPADLAALAQPEVLARVLGQLLDNAARAIPAGRAGRIAVRGEAAVGRARIVVEDDGVGMAAETLQRAFDPFFSTRPFGTGRGMGLSVALGLAQSMRGDLRLESATGQGTRAILELPLAEGPPAARGAPGNSGLPGSS